LVFSDADTSHEQRSSRLQRVELSTRGSLIRLHRNSHPEVDLSGSEPPLAADSQGQPPAADSQGQPPLAADSQGQPQAPDSEPQLPDSRMANVIKPVDMRISENITQISGIFDFVAKDGPDLMLSIPVMDMVKQTIADAAGVPEGDVTANFEEPAVPLAKDRLGVMAVSYKFRVPANKSSDISKKITFANWEALANKMRDKFTAKGFDGTGLGVTKFNAAVETLQVLGPLVPTSTDAPQPSQPFMNDPKAVNTPLGPLVLTSITKINPLVALLVLLLAGVAICWWQFPKRMDKAPAPVGNQRGMTEGVLRTPAATMSSLF